MQGATMCGILGILGRVDEANFTKALHTLTHRGPDAFGVYAGESITLGHRRLSIIDTNEQSNQPMHFTNSNICGGGGRNDERPLYSIVFNGEIYNYIELKEQLKAKGYIFHTQSDTEVALASFIEWGESCLNRFNGMWALAIYDHRAKRLFLSRDRFGKKPLFYAFITTSKGEKQLIFASEMKAIYPYLAQISPSHTFSAMSARANIFSYPQTHDTLVDGIYRFPYSHYAYINLGDGSLTPTRYYNILDHLRPAPSTYELAKQEFFTLFCDAVRVRMRSDVTIGTALSGGLDSSAVICTMAHLAKQGAEAQKDWQHAFVACFKDTHQDESWYAKQVVDHIGVEATFKEIEPLKEWDNIYKYFYMLEDLYGRILLHDILIYKEQRSNGITVSLDGHGSDELFCGYGHIPYALWDSRFHPVRLWQLMHTTNGTRLHPESSFKVLKSSLNMLARTGVKRLIGREIVASTDSSHPNFKAMDTLNQVLYVLFFETLLPVIIRDYDKCSMISSIEIRMPFMDHRLVEFLFSLPYHYKVGGGYTKKLLRDSIGTLMPSSVTWRKPKLGFNAPMADWIARDKSHNGLKEWFLDIAHSQDFLECPLVPNAKETKEQILALANGNIAQENAQNTAEEVWCALNPYLWQKSIAQYALRF